MEMMKAVSFMYVRPLGYNPESAQAAEIADERKNQEQSNPQQDPSVDGASTSIQSKRLRVGDNEGEEKSVVQFQASSPSKSRILESDNCGSSDRFNIRATPRRMETGFFSKIPPELFHHILKFLSSERFGGFMIWDLVSCALVCRFLNFAASNESLWRRFGYLKCLSRPIGFSNVGTVCDGVCCPLPKGCESVLDKSFTFSVMERTWLNLVGIAPLSSKSITSKCRQQNEAKHLSLLSTLLDNNLLVVNDDQIILDKTVADQVSIWKSSRGLTDKVVPNHDCSGETCSYYQIGDVFVCEKTGQVHVCDDTCREAVLDPTNVLLVCTISGHCFDLLLSPSEMEPDTVKEISFNLYLVSFVI
ncbi:hypothetical protein HYC85_015003 [Camellia sinensis]|uniref:F-box domain-containing protein n=1 Tax=Camellia sinensis TaxID=4442 RepID=A0A7J7HB93_CAMSI|nr:hypothetical protein HYC85_015003 [Camellia sinensis]